MSAPLDVAARDLVNAVERAVLHARFDLDDGNVRVEGASWDRLLRDARALAARLEGQEAPIEFTDYGTRGPRRYRPRRLSAPLSREEERLWRRQMQDPSDLRVWATLDAEREKVRLLREAFEDAAVSFHLIGEKGNPHYDSSFEECTVPVCVARRKVLTATEAPADPTPIERYEAERKERHSHMPGFPRDVAEAPADRERET